MKNITIVIFSCLALGACGTSPTVSKGPVPANPADDARQTETVAAHTVEKDKELKNLDSKASSGESDKKSSWSRSGDPIDTTNFDREIADAEKALKSEPDSADKKSALSDAYYKRGFALTQARQYASAIGDYRAALKFNPANEDAKKWIATISGIYKSMNREIPPPGDEPKPLEFKKENDKSKS